MKDNFLPIGSVVLLKNGKKEVMITGFCVFPQKDSKTIGKDGEVDTKGKMFEYSGCIYPEGITRSDTTILFNRKNIEKVCFTGYETDSSKKLSDFLTKGMKEIENKNMVQE